MRTEKGVQKYIKSAKQYHIMLNRHNFEMNNWPRVSDVSSSKFWYRSPTVSVTAFNPNNYVFMTGPCPVRYFILN